MALLSLLSRYGSSLQAHTGQSATASHNMSNANTPGFARQRGTLAAAAVSMEGGALIGQGVTLSNIGQARDAFVEQRMPAALGASAQSAEEARALEGLSAMDPAGGAGLSSALGAFYGALRLVAQNPGDRGARSAALASARNVALSFNRAASELAGARAGLDTALAGDAERVNALSRSVAELNGQIRIERAAGGAPNDLLDARLRAQDELVSLTGASVVPNANGDVSLVLPNGGPALVDGDHAAVVSTSADPANQLHLALSVRAPSGSSSTVAAAQWGGAMRGRLDARDGALATAESSVDTLAFDWAATVNTAHQAGFGLDGVNGRSLFTTSATATGAARSIQVDATVLADPARLAASSSALGVPGDGANMLAVIQTESAALSNGLSAIDGFASAIAQFGGAAQTARSAADRDEAVRTQLETLRESTSGVSVDEELVALTQAQRGYQAVLKVITTTDQMLQTLLEMK